MTTLVHGFLGGIADWDEFRAYYRFESQALSLPGHDDEPPLMHHSIKELSHFISRKVEPDSNLIGYSLGGRVALQIALDRPELVSRLVLISSSPGIALEADRQKRQTEDSVRAKTVESDFENFLYQWYSQEIFADLRDDEHFHAIVERRAKLNPGVVSRVLLEASPGLNPSNWSRIHELKIPTLFIVGEDDSKYVSTGREIVDLNPFITLEIIPNAGHALHLTHPEDLAACVRQWIGH
jgi:2-succinyl-6-hydroxy-2,4-cyclohexadiene-1-carboxylate synthase